MVLGILGRASDILLGLPQQLKCRQQMRPSSALKQELRFKYAIQIQKCLLSWD